MKTFEERLNILENSLKNLQEAFIQSQSNNAASNGEQDHISNNLDNTMGVTDKNTADIDYVAMMTDVELPE